jgi:hypothetical protein
MRSLWLLLLASVSFAQAPPPSLYQYFGETGASGNATGNFASTTGFGLRIGSSNAFWVTDVDTAIRPGGAVSTIRSGGEYHVAILGKWEFLGFAAAGVSVDTTQSAAVGLGNFSGGFGMSYDVGNLLSKGKISLPLVGEFRMTAVTATSVTPVYSLLFRKTF